MDRHREDAATGLRPSPEWESWYAQT